MSSQTPTLEKFINDFKVEAERIIQEHRKFLDELRKELKIKNDTDPKLLIYIDDLSKKHRNNGTFEELSLTEKVYSALSIIGLIEELELARDSDLNQFLSMFLLGYACAVLDKYDPKLIPINLYKDYYHSMKSRAATNQRWRKKREQTEEALKIAEKKWRDGDEALHYEMAECLSNLKKNGKQRFPELSYEILKKELKPIAKNIIVCLVSKESPKTYNLS